MPMSARKRNVRRVSAAAFAVAIAPMIRSRAASAQSLPPAEVEIGEAGGATTPFAARSSGPVVTIGDAEPPTTHHAQDSHVTVFVTPTPLTHALFPPSFDDETVPPLVSRGIVAQRRFRRMAIAGGVVLGALTVVTAIGSFVTFSGRPSGVDLVQSWLALVPVVGTSIDAVLEISQPTGNGFVSALLIFDALGQAAALAMLVRGAIEPASTPSETRRRERARWYLSPSLGSASGLALTVTTF
jgi:hypothetical protein